MTLRQRKLAREYLRTGSKTRAAIAAGYSPRTAYSMGGQQLRKIEPELNRLMDRAGLSEKALLEPIRNGLKARAIFQGVESDAPDHSNRLKSSELAWKLRGHLRNTDAGSAPTHPIIVFNIRTSDGEPHDAISISESEEAPAIPVADSSLKT